MATVQGSQSMVHKRYSLPFFIPLGGKDGDRTPEQATPKNFENAP